MQVPISKQSQQTLEMALINGHKKKKNPIKISLRMFQFPNYNTPGVFVCVCVVVLIYYISKLDSSLYLSL